MCLGSHATGVGTFGSTAHPARKAAHPKGCSHQSSGNPTSYRFWSSAAFLIHISFSFFSMLFQVISMAFKAFTRSFWRQTGVSAMGGGHLGLEAARVDGLLSSPSPAPCHLEAGQVVPDDTLLPDLLGSLG